MELTIDIPDRTYTNLKSFCEANGTEIAVYVVSAINERFSLDRFGDMNEMIKKTEPKKRAPRKKKETAANATEPSTPSEEEKNVEKEEGKAAETTSDTGELKQKSTRRRLLKVK